MSADDDLLIDAFQATAPGGIDALVIAQQLRAYVALLLRWNRTFNLVSRRDTHRLLRRHVLDALQLLPYLRGPRVLDVGTGAGLPGMVLAIARPDLEFTLLDKVARKVRFLVQARAELGLANVATVCGDALNWRSPGPFDTVTVRAVATGANLQAMVLPHLAAHGRLLAQLGMGHCDKDQPGKDQPGKHQSSMNTDDALPAALQRQAEHRYRLPEVAGEFRIVIMGWPNA